jgi:hypothetical protein
MASLFLDLESHVLLEVLKKTLLLLINLLNHLVYVRVYRFLELAQQVVYLIINVEVEILLVRA